MPDPRRRGGTRVRSTSVSAEGSTRPAERTGSERPDGAGSELPRERRRGAGPELLLELQRGAGPLRAQLEAGLRAAIREGRLAVGRAAAVLADAGPRPRRLAPARRRGLRAARGRGLPGRAAGRRARSSRRRPPPSPAAPPRPPPAARAPTTSSPGVRDLAAFPRAAWLRATARRPARGARRRAGLPRRRAGVPALRRRWPRTSAAPAASSPTRAGSSCAPASPRRLALLGRVAARAPATRPSRSRTRACPRTAPSSRPPGCEVVPVPVDDEGLRVDAAARRRAPAAVVVTPAHQFPLGVALAPARRAALTRLGPRARRARGRGRLRRRVPLRPPARRRAAGARARAGSPTSARPARRSRPACASAGWCSRPGSRGRWPRPRRSRTAGAPVLDQLVLARLLGTAAYDRHLRLTRRRLTGRRDRRRRGGGRAPPGRARRRGSPPACTPSCACRPRSTPTRCWPPPPDATSAPGRWCRGRASGRRPPAGLRQPARAGAARRASGASPPQWRRPAEAAPSLSSTARHAEDEDPLRHEEALQGHRGRQGSWPSRLHEPHPREEVAEEEAPPRKPR